MDTKELNVKYNNIYYIRNGIIAISFLATLLLNNFLYSNLLYFITYIIAAFSALYLVKNFIQDIKNGHKVIITKSALIIPLFVKNKIIMLSTLKNIEISQKYIVITLVNDKIIAFKYFHKLVNDTQEFINIFNSNKTDMLSNTTAKVNIQI